MNTTSNKRKRRTKVVAKKAAPAPPRDITLRGALAQLSLKLFGTPAEEAGELLGNEVSYFKATRLLALSEKLTDELRTRRVTRAVARKLPFGLAARIIRDAAEEDSEEVTAMWAKLIASGLDPKSPPITKAFASILADLDGLEAIILRCIWRRDADLARARGKRISGVQAELSKILAEVALSERAVAITNLIRLGCLRMRLDGYYVDNIHVDAIHFSLGADRDTMREISDSVAALKRLIIDLSGARNYAYLGLDKEGTTDSSWEPEHFFELTELAVELMRRCEPLS